MSLKHRSADFWLGAGLLLFVSSLAVTVFAHARYAQAEDVYHSLLTHVTFAPHANVSGTLQSALLVTHHWLLIQAICTTVTLVVTVGVLLQVVRRRNARTAAEAAED